MDDFIDHVNLRIPEDRIEDALSFYRDVLGFETWRFDDYQNDERTSFFFKISDTAVLNMRPVSDFERPSGKNYDHFCIAVGRDLDELKEKLEDAGHEILREGTPLGTQGRARALYVEDPFSYVIELKTR